MWSALLAMTLAVTAQTSRPISAASSSRSAEIATLAAELEASSAATHPGKPRDLYTTGRSAAFHKYVMACLNRIVLQSASDPGQTHRLRPGSSLLLSLVILPGGAVKSVEIFFNDGGAALE